RFETALVLSLRLPKVIARVGQDWAQAGVTSPSAIGRPWSFAFWRAPAMRWTQNVHFSITPWPRCVTSGFNINGSGSGQFSSAKSNQLKRRTLYGQLFEQ